jgi:DNA modification methylase
VRCFSLELDQIIHGNTLSVLNTLPNESIDCVITSPPYWGLRDYGIEGQLGLEPTFKEYIEHLQTIFDEVYRVLKKTGTCWVNLGDSYAGSGKGYGGNNHGKLGKHANEFLPAPIDTEIPNKSLCNIPHRFAISMTDNGWIQRNTIIWHKPSCMPSSAKDRFTVDFEYVFLFSKNKKYYFEQQFEALSEASLERMKYPVNQVTSGAIYPNESRDTPYINKNGNSGMHYNPNGRNKRTVWRINPQPFKDAHFAVFPEKLVEPMIKAGCPPSICDMCNKPYLPEYETKEGDVVETYTGEATKDYKSAMAQNPSDTKRRVIDSMRTKKTHIGYKPQCDCNAPTHAGIVLDPFVGSGTTCLVARKLQRHYIGIDLNEDYVTMARKRLVEVL